MVILFWLGVRDSNPRMPGPEPGALPLGQLPLFGGNSGIVTD